MNPRPRLIPHVKHLRQVVRKAEVSGGRVPDVVERHLRTVGHPGLLAGDLAHACERAVGRLAPDYGAGHVSPVPALLVEGVGVGVVLDDLAAVLVNAAPVFGC